MLDLLLGLSLYSLKPCSRVTASGTQFCMLDPEIAQTLYQSTTKVYQVAIEFFNSQLYSSFAP